MRPSLSFSTTKVIRALNESVWRVIGDFGNEHVWYADMKRCTRDTSDVRVGTTRTCELTKPVMGVTEAVETLTEYDAGKVLAYRLHGAAGPFAAAQSRWTTTPLPDGSTSLTIEGRFEPKNAAVRWLLWPLARPMVARLARRTIVQLERHLAGSRAVAA